MEATYCGMYIPLSDDKHRFVRQLTLHTGNLRQHLRQFIFLLFLTKFFSRQNFFSGILSWTQFCLGFYLGLHTAVVFCMQSFNYTCVLTCIQMLLLIPRRMLTRSRTRCPYRTAHLFHPRVKIHMNTCIATWLTMEKSQGMREIQCVRKIHMTTRIATWLTMEINQRMREIQCVLYNA